MLNKALPLSLLPSSATIYRPFLSLTIYSVTQMAMLGLQVGSIWLRAGLRLRIKIFSGIKLVLELLEWSAVHNSNEAFIII